MLKTLLEECCYLFVSFICAKLNFLYATVIFKSQVFSWIFFIMLLRLFFTDC